MPLDIFSGDHLPSLMARARENLGPDACIIQVRRRGGTFELIAAAESALAAPTLPPAPVPAMASRPVPVVATPARPEVVEAEAESADFATHLNAELALGAVPARAVSSRKGDSRRTAPVFAPAGTRLRPHIVALVGPTGAGKTTTIAKLASNPAAFGNKRVGLLGLDTWRIAATDQLRAWGELAGSSVEIAWDEASLRRSALRLVECDVVLIDTPGRGPREIEAREELARVLELIQPDEVHLTLPAAEMPAVSRGHIAHFRRYGLTHLLATKVDECPEAVRVFDIAAAAGHPMRWLTDGQGVPDDLHSAAERLSEAVRSRAARQRQVA